MMVRKLARKGKEVAGEDGVSVASRVAEAGGDGAAAPRYASQLIRTTIPSHALQPHGDLLTFPLLQPRADPSTLDDPSAPPPVPITSTVVPPTTPPPTPTKSLAIALVGAPNSGKSSLLNAVVGQGVAAVSRKAQMTRRRAAGIRTEGDRQLVFLDTPGLIDPASMARRRRGQSVASLVPEVADALREAQVVLWVIDAARRLSVHDEQVLRNIRRFLDVPGMTGRTDGEGEGEGEEEEPVSLWLVMNKLDLVRDREALLEKESQAAQLARHVGFPLVPPARAVDALKRGRHHLNGLTVETPLDDLALNHLLPPPPTSPPRADSPFAASFAVSARTKRHVPRLLASLSTAALPGPLLYPTSWTSDIPVMDRLLECVREALYENLHDELPYLTRLVPFGWTVLANGELRLDVTVHVASTRNKRALVGERGRAIVSITVQSRAKIEKLLGRPVHLFLHVKTDRGGERK
jgi:small GTP-binding protein